jgi:predicted phage terminase large subunit-like protein
MPLVKTPSVYKGMSAWERKKLFIMVQEMRSRGMRLPTQLAFMDKKWPVDSRGYFVKLDGKQYIPSENQEGFVLSRAVFSSFWGSRTCGKSCGGSQKALHKIMSGQNGTVINPDFENLKISTWPEFREWIPWDMVVPSQKYRRNIEWQPNQPFNMSFINGVKVIVKGVKDPDSARGPNVNWLWYDEAQRDTDGASWKIAVASVRIGEEPQAWATFTPNGADHWTTSFFIDMDIPEDAKELFEKLAGNRPLIEAFHGTIFDNQANIAPEFMASMLAAYPSGWLRQQEIYGEVVKKEGALGDSSWFDGKLIPAPPEGMRHRVRYWDLAATEKKITGKKVNDPDETVGTLMSWDGKETFYIEDQVCGFWAWDDLKKNILDTARIDGELVKQVVEQEPAAGGKNQVAELTNYLRDKLPGHSSLEGYRPEGDKVMRANTWFAEAKMGKIFIVNGIWVQPFFNQLNCFNLCRHDDKIDSVSGARYSIAPIKKWAKIDFLSL